jgi:hypothetical protein
LSEVIEKGIARLVYQFNSSSKFQDFLEAFLQQLQDLKISDLQLLNERYLDTAVGAQLDGIGEIVGIDRPKAAIDIIGAFGFLTDNTARGFGSTIADIGGNFVNKNSTEELIGDDLYRIIIRVKIIKNQTAMTVDDTTRLISFMFGNVEVRYFLFENLKPIYAIGKIITPLEIFLLDNIPILIGIEDVTYFMSYNENAFSFDGDISGLGFGDINNPLIGGNFAKII